MSQALRWLVVAAVLVLLARAGRYAWRRRALAVRVWRAVRPRHVLGAVALMTVVVGTLLGLMAAVPVTRWGLGSLIGLDGNAVFAPIESTLAAPAAAPTAGGASPATGPPWAGIALVSGFCGLLVLLFPHLADVEERTFRAGLEGASPGRELWAALRFGLAHLVMLIPLAAALAVAVAGVVYGRVYRRAYRRAAVPVPLDVAGVALEVVDRRAAREAGVFAATVWHTTFNTLVAVLVVAGYVAGALLG